MVMAGGRRPRPAAAPCLTGRYVELKLLQIAPSHLLTPEQFPYLTGSQFTVDGGALPTV
ncbi:MAG: hypothetical protein ACRDMI_04675 [Streptosporangiaceae bacterium]